jgi:glucokinase
MAQAAKDVADMCNLTFKDFPCVGVGVPSCINPHSGLLVFANNTNWRNAPLREELRKHIPIPVYIGNDANCAVVGEAMAGAARGKQDVLMITLGTGLGGGLISGGKLYLGADGMGMEPGHTVLVHDGIECTCGLKGCLESYGSVVALIRQAQEAMEQCPESGLHKAMTDNGGKLNGKLIFDCAISGDKTAQRVVDQFLEYVANGIGSLVNLFRPEVVLIGGGICNAGDYLMKPLNEKLPKYVFASDIIGCPPAIRATLGNAAGTIGAACLDCM